MKFFWIYAFLISALYGCIIKEPEKIPVISPPPKDTIRKNLVVTITKDQSVIMGSSKIKLSEIDSVLKAKVDSLKKQHYAPGVVISADSFAYYKNVFIVMQAAAKARAKVVANVK